MPTRRPARNGRGAAGPMRSALPPRLGLERGSSRGLFLT